MGLLLGCLEGLAQNKPHLEAGFAKRDNKVITHINQYWRLKSDEQAVPRPIDVTLTAFYYDPDWKNLWGEQNGEAVFLNLSPSAMPFKSGDRVNLKGMISLKGFVPDPDGVTVLPPDKVSDPIEVGENIADWNRLNARRVAIEGKVEYQFDKDPTHIGMVISLKGFKVFAWIRREENQFMASLEGSLVRLIGVYQRNPDTPEQPAQIEAWVAKPSDVQTIERIGEYAIYNLPAKPIASIETSAKEQKVRIIGTVVAQKPGETITLVDNTGEAVVEVRQGEQLAKGEEVEAVGIPYLDGNKYRFKQGTFRKTSNSNATLEKPKDLIRHVNDFYRLSPDQQARPHPIDITVTALIYDPDWTNLWGEEDGDPIYLHLSHTTMPFKSGDRVHIKGKYSNDGLIADPNGVTVLPAVKTTPPIQVRENFLEWGNLNGRLCTLEGLVDQQYEQDARHHAIIVIVNGWKFIVWVLHEPGELVPSYEGYIIRFSGIYSRTSDTLNRLIQTEVWVANSSAISVVSHLSKSPLFNIPVTAIESFPETQPNQKVRVAGRVLSQATGRTVTVRDESGQAIIETAQTDILKPGDFIEAVGIPYTDGVLYRLKESCYRKQVESKSSNAKGPPDILPRLRIAEQVRELSLEDAAKHYPVRLRAAVTWAHPDADFFFVQDSSGGLRVEASAKDREGLKIAHRAEVIGETTAGATAPIVRASYVRMHSPIGLPNIKSLTLEQALTGIGEAELVEMTGFLQHMGRDGNWQRLSLTTPSGVFSALLPSSEQTAHLSNNVLRIRGVCTATVNDRGRVTGVELWVKSVADITTVGSIPADPFSLPRQPIANLGKFGTRTASNEWVCTRGTVTLHEPGHHLSIQDGSDSLHVLSRSTLPLTEGDIVEVVGLPGREETHYILREAIYRKTGTRGNVTPIDLISPYVANDELDWCLVRIEGELLDRSERPGSIHLVLRAGKTIFECELNNPPATHYKMDSWKPGTLLRVTGVCSVRYNEYFQPQDFRLILRSSDDVLVTRAATWWTAQRAITTAIVLALLTAMGTFWVVLLRQKVREQTSTIREQMEKEALLVAELERSSRLESLGVLAGGIAHDFNNLLTVIIGNVGLARMDSNVEASAGALLAEAERGAQRARSLTQQLLTFARGGNPVKSAQPVGPLIREASMQAIGQGKISCSHNFSPELWPAVVDKDQFSQVIHNIVLNAVQAMPDGGRLSIDASNQEVGADRVPSLAEGKYIKIVISDTGAGIPAEHLGKVFDPYFSTKGGKHGLGLATVRSIIRKHEGYVEVSSQPGKGANFILWLPATTETKAITTTRSHSPFVRQPLGDVSILFMDDEEPIQLMASVLFKKMGCRYALTGDGTKALEEYVRAKEAGKPFDLVITDLTVPNGMGGKELMDALKKVDPNARVIVSSGYSSDPVLANFREYGFVAMVPKPYLIEELEKTIRISLITTSSSKKGA